MLAGLLGWPDDDRPIGLVDNLTSNDCNILTNIASVTPRKQKSTRTSKAINLMLLSIFGSLINRAFAQISIRFKCYVADNMLAPQRVGG